MIAYLLRRLLATIPVMLVGRVCSSSPCYTSAPETPPQ